MADSDPSHGGSERKARILILLMFFASGASALMYQVVWLRMLSRIVGVTTYATAVTVGAFMAGLALGSYLFGSYADRKKDLLKVYAAMEFLIALFALLTPLLLNITFPLYRAAYDMVGGDTTLMLLIRVVICFILLLIPTTLMGGTLPVLSSLVARMPIVGLSRDTGEVTKNHFGQNFALLYGLNTLGAVIGVLLSGFVLIGAIGEMSTIYTGVVINLAIALTARTISQRKMITLDMVAKGAKSADAVMEAKRISPYSATIRKVVLGTIFISGFTAIAYEVLWSRQLIFYLGTSIYAFSAMLAVYLVGISFGSMAVNRILDKHEQPLLLLGVMELAIGAISLVNLYLYPLLDSRLIFHLIAPVVLVFPLTVLFGAMFPIASRCFTQNVDNAGASVGRLACFNTIGSVAGSMVTGLVLMATIGSVRTIMIMALINTLLGIVFLALEPGRRKTAATAVLIALPLFCLMVYGLQGRNPVLDTFEERIERWSGERTIHFNLECRDGTITGFRAFDNHWLFRNGVGQTSLGVETKLMAHLPLLLAENPSNFLAVCYGMGTTVRSASVYDGLDITSVELIPELFDLTSSYHDDTDEYLYEDNIHLIGEDGRNFLMTTPKQFDVIIIDPSPPIYAAGTVNLLTKEFFELCNERTTETGVTCLWYPYGMGPEGGSEIDALHVLSSFRLVFPYVTVWKGPHGVGWIMAGGKKRYEVDKAKFDALYENEDVVRDFTEYDQLCATSDQLFDLLFMTDEQVSQVTDPSLAITDNYPYTEFMLWRRISAYLNGR